MTLPLDFTHPDIQTPYPGCYWNPLYLMQIQKWLRDTHNLAVCVDFRETKGKRVRGINSVCYDVMVYRLFGGDANKLYKHTEYDDNYERALEKGIQEALKWI
jgi:hypothetical protein